MRGRQRIAERCRGIVFAIAAMTPVGVAALTVFETWREATASSSGPADGRR